MAFNSIKGMMSGAPNQFPPASSASVPDQNEKTKSVSKSHVAKSHVKKSHVKNQFFKKKF